MSDETQQVLDFFCGAGGFTLGVQRAGANVIAGVDNDEQALETYNANFEHPAYNYDLAETDPEDFDAETGIRPHMVDGIVGGPPCLPPDEPVLTSSGHTPIADVSVGDTVLTHTGAKKTVIDTGSKAVDEDIVHLNLMYRGDNLRITKEHPVLTHHGWKDAGDLTEDDYVAFPVRNEHGSIHTTRNLNLKDESVWYLVGLYLAEGWRRTNDSEKPEISLGVHEDEVDHVQSAITEAFPEKSSWTHSTEGKGVRVTFQHDDFHAFLGRFGDGAHQKRIPQSYLYGLYRARAEPLLDGYIFGDGSVDDNRIRYTTVSRELAEGVQILWYRTHGLLPSLRLEDTSEYENSIINGREIERGEHYVGQATRSENLCLGEVGDTIYLPVSEVSCESYTGEVYNLEVEDDNSYCTPLAAVHNCQGFSTANLQRDEDDPRNNLVFRYATYVDYYQPDWFVMENVTGIESIDDGETIELLYEDFQQAGYKVDHATLNAADYGVPQKRRRVFFVGTHEDADNEVQFPEPTHAPVSEIDQTAVAADRVGVTADD